MWRIIMTFLMFSIVQNAQTWHQIDAVYESNPYHAGAKGLFLDRQNGWCTNGYLYNTTDGGYTWKRVEFDKSDFTVVDFFSPYFGLASTLDKVYKTTDSGNSWYLLPNTPSYIVSVDFADSLNGVLCAKSSSSKYKIHYTTDGGNNWANSIIPHPDSIVIDKFQFLDDGIGWAFGDYHRGGLVLKTTDCGQTWETKLSNRHDIPGGYFLNENFGAAVLYLAGESFISQMMEVIHGNQNLFQNTMGVEIFTSWMIV